MAHDDEQIPASAYVNFQVLYEMHMAIKEGTAKTTVEELLHRTSSRLGSQPPLSEFFSPMTPGGLMGFVYCTLVVPKELASTDYFSNFTVDVSDYFTLTSYFESDQDAIEIFNGLDFFRIMRNAVAHVNYCLSNSTGIEFWNNNKQQKETIRVATDVNRLTNFAVKVAEYCIEQRNAKTALK